MGIPEYTSRLDDRDSVSAGAHASAYFPVTFGAVTRDRRALPGLLRLMGSGLMLVLGLTGHANQGELFFDLPAQPLPLSLEAFSEQTGVSILVTSDRIKDKTATAVQGRFAADDALTQLLQGTGLRSRRLGESALTLVPVSGGSHDNAPPRRATLPDGYASALQRAVLSTLCKHQPLQVGRFRLVLQLWLDDHGSVTRVHIPDRADDALWGDTVRASFQGEILPAPPAGLPQPVTLLLRPAPPSCQGTPRP